MQATLNELGCIDAARANSVEDLSDQTRERTGVRGKLPAMAPEAREPAIAVVEILPDRADQHHLGLIPWMARPLFVARQDTERRPGLSAAGP